MTGPTDAIVRGVAASRGSETGTVVTVENITEGRPLPDGPLVVVGEMIPPDITTFTPAVRGIVTDEGGILCHGATLAREMRIPAVVGTGNGSEILAQGMRVTVNGDEGVVYAA